MKDTRINKWSDDDIAQLIALRRTGATNGEIAAKLRHWLEAHAEGER